MLEIPIYLAILVSSEIPRKLKGESALHTILPSRMEGSYSPTFSDFGLFMGSPKKFFLNFLPLPECRSPTFLLSCSNFVVTSICADLQ